MRRHSILLLGSGLLALPAVACGVCFFERQAVVAVDTRVAAERGVALEKLEPEPGYHRELGTAHLAADGTPVCGKLCPPGGPQAVCYLKRIDGGALTVDCRDHPPCE